MDFNELPRVANLTSRIPTSDPFKILPINPPTKLSQLPSNDRSNGLCSVLFFFLFRLDVNESGGIDAGDVDLAVQVKFFFLLFQSLFFLYKKHGFLSRWSSLIHSELIWWIFYVIRKYVNREVGLRAMKSIRR